MRMILTRCLRPQGGLTAGASRAHSSAQALPLHYDEFKTRANDRPILIAHGMLGSASNWTSVAKAVHRKTQRHVVAVDARNHGLSPHSDEMSYWAMSRDLVHLMKEELKWDQATLIGHSMGGRTMMLTALNHPELVDKLVPVDISPVNHEFDETDSIEWNMSHFFHAMQAVKFTQGVPISQSRKDADRQLSKRIHDPMIRAWLLMNVMQDESTNEIRWRVNVDGIYKAFKHHLGNVQRIRIVHSVCNKSSFSAVFPEEHCETYEGPTLFIGGEKSDYIPVAEHDQIKEVFTRAKFEYIQGAGHWVHSQKPTEFLEVLLKFIED
eukprot:maker-scaffold540_size141973-snap-gene-0.21 protein:Tk04350 transcript:maker-scaffold540_size141973-snap-gene-0.21-mRNA-1 annotation:"abhydrolase domain-containing protein 11"